MNTNTYNNNMHMSISPLSLYHVLDYCIGFSTLF